MAILEKINPRKSISLLLFYVAMALNIVSFDLFLAIDSNSNESPRVENLELVIQQSNTSNNSNSEFTVDQFVPVKVHDTTLQPLFQYQKRLFHDNRNFAYQFKELAKNQLIVNHQSHQQIALIISYQKMEEEDSRHLA